MSRASSTTAPGREGVGMDGGPQALNLVRVAGAFSPRCGAFVADLATANRDLCRGLPDEVLQLAGVGTYTPAFFAGRDGAGVVHADLSVAPTQADRSAIARCLAGFMRQAPANLTQVPLC